MSLSLNNSCRSFIMRRINILSTITTKSKVPETAMSLQLTTAKDLKHSRQLHTVEARSHAVGKLTQNYKPDWDRAVTEGEKIIGYPTSSLNLHNRFSDDIAKAAHHLKKLEGSNHPLLQTAKSLQDKESNNKQPFNIILLLFSKAAAQLNNKETQQDESAKILDSQRLLAELVEMIRTSYLIQNSSLNIYRGLDSEPSDRVSLFYGNKLALLIGDFLLAKVNMELATLGNHDLMDLMSCAVRDLAEAEFHGRRDKQNMPLPTVEGASDPLDDWTKRNVLSSGSLLGKGCQGTLLLAGQCDQLQQQAYEFGLNLALAWQARLELEPFLPGSNYIPGSTFSLTSAPVMFHLEQDPNLFTEIDKGEESVCDVNYATVYEIVSKGPGVESTKRLQKKHSQKVVEMLEVFEESVARTALYNIIEAMASSDDLQNPSEIETAASWNRFEELRHPAVSAETTLGF